MNTYLQSLGSTIMSAVLCLSGTVLPANSTAQNPPQMASQGTPEANVWPQRPIRIVTPYASGFGFDVTLRRITPELSRLLGQAVIVENRPGGGGRTAASEAAAAKPDGYTFVMADSAPNLMSPTAGAKVMFDPQKEFVPVVRIVNSYAFLAVPGSSNLKTLADLGTLDHAPVFGMTGLAGYAHATCGALGRALGFECRPVPYPQGNIAALMDLVKGQIDLALTMANEAPGLIDSGKIRLLATMAPTREPRFPQVPSISEFTTAEVNQAVWAGLFAPAGTPDAVVARLRHAVNQVMAGSGFRSWAEASGYSPQMPDNIDFAKFLHDQRVALLGDDKACRLAKGT